jgi:hypothetical protein
MTGEQRLIEVVSALDEVQMPYLIMGGHVVRILQCLPLPSLQHSIHCLQRQSHDIGITAFDAFDEA